MQINFVLFEHTDKRDFQQILDVFLVKAFKKMGAPAEVSCQKMGAIFNAARAAIREECQSMDIFLTNADVPEEIVAELIDAGIAEVRYADYERATEIDQA
jgi:uncharacterized protein with ACT and thioredoxin-like domain